jgi:hypothetical protein
MSLRLQDGERAGYARDGYVIRHGAFGAGDLATLRAAAEELVSGLEASASRKRSHGSYVFQTDLEQAITIKWESDRKIILGIEPFAHLHATFRDYAADPRFVEPMKDIVGADEIGLFTEKLNMKRAGVGGPIVLHQDYPYWVPVSDDVDAIATAMLFLDDATQANGCLEVAPGSHARGVQKTREQQGFSGEIDPEAFDTSALVPVEVPAGGLVMFGPRLVHRSMPNTSGSDRRALLYSYQPAEYRHSLEFLRERWAAEAAS